MRTRQCGDCQLCCKLLPMHDNEELLRGRPPLHKAAGERCRYQRHHKGCAIYADRPWACRMWNCRWLVNDDAAELSRPDRSHYVIDVMPDFVTVVDNATGEKTNVQVVQIWIDPDCPDAHRDPALRRWLERRNEQGLGQVAALIRYNARDAITLIPPSMSQDRQWHEYREGITENRTHTATEVVEALGGEALMVIEDETTGDEISVPYPSPSTSAGPA